MHETRNVSAASDMEHHVIRSAADMYIAICIGKRDAVDYVYADSGDVCCGHC